MRPTDLAYLAAAVPWLAVRLVRSGKGRGRFLSRCLGRVAAPPRTGPVVWFHGVSLGEVIALGPVVGQFRRHRPDAVCVVSATTDTGLAEARRRFAGLTVIDWPLDFSWAVGRALDTVRPDLVVLAEGELWPNFLAAARRRGVPVAVVNGRFSPRSARTYRRLGRAARRWLLDPVTLFAVQTEEYAAHLRDLGVPAERVTVTGSVKYDGAAGDRSDPKTRALADLLGARPGEVVWVAGSTQAPEERFALDIHRRLAGVRLVVVPRQPERFDEVARLMEAAGRPIVRRSRLTAPPPADAVVLWDTVGELGALWGAADVAFVGGSLDGKRGGQNVIEPAAYGVPVVTGRHSWNFRDVVARLEAAGGLVKVADAAGLQAAVTRLVADAGERRRVGEAGRALVRSQQGATGRTVEALVALLASRKREVGLC